MAGLRGFELPEDDSSNSHQLPEKGPTTLSAFTPISAGISVRWTKRHLEVRILSAQARKEMPPSCPEANGLAILWSNQNGRGFRYTQVMSTPPPGGVGTIISIGRAGYFPEPCQRPMLPSRRPQPLGWREALRYSRLRGD
jgi:hypothetical protein